MANLLKFPLDYDVPLNELKAPEGEDLLLINSWPWMDYQPCMKKEKVFEDCIDDVGLYSQRMMDRLSSFKTISAGKIYSMLYTELQVELQNYVFKKSLDYFENFEDIKDNSQESITLIWKNQDKKETFQRQKEDPLAILVDILCAFSDDDFYRFFPKDHHDNFLLALFLKHKFDVKEFNTKTEFNYGIHLKVPVKLEKDSALIMALTSTDFFNTTVEKFIEHFEDKINLPWLKKNLFVLLGGQNKEELLGQVFEHKVCSDEIYIVLHLKPSSPNCHYILQKVPPSLLNIKDYRPCLHDQDFDKFIKPVIKEGAMGYFNQHSPNSNHLVEDLKKILRQPPVSTYWGLLRRSNELFQIIGPQFENKTLLGTEKQIYSIPGFSILLEKEKSIRNSMIQTIIENREEFHKIKTEMDYIEERLENEGKKPISNTNDEEESDTEDEQMKTKYPMLIIIDREEKEYWQTIFKDVEGIVFSPTKWSENLQVIVMTTQDVTQMPKKWDMTEVHFSVIIVNNCCNGEHFAKLAQEIHYRFMILVSDTQLKGNSLNKLPFLKMLYIFGELETKFDPALLPHYHSLWPNKPEGDKYKLILKKDDSQQEEKQPIIRRQRSTRQVKKSEIKEEIKKEEPSIVTRRRSTIVMTGPIVEQEKNEEKKPLKRTRGKTQQQQQQVKKPNNDRLVSLLLDKQPKILKGYENVMVHEIPCPSIYKRSEQFFRNGQPEHLRPIMEDLYAGGIINHPQKLTLLSVPSITSDSISITQVSNDSPKQSECLLCYQVLQDPVTFCDEKHAYCFNCLATWIYQSKSIKCCSVLQDISQVTSLKGIIPKIMNTFEGFEKSSIFIDSKNSPDEKPLTFMEKFNYMNKHLNPLKKFILITQYDRIKSIAENSFTCYDSYEQFEACENDKAVLILPWDVFTNNKMDLSLLNDYPIVVNDVSTKHEHGFKNLLSSQDKNPIHILVFQYGLDLLLLHNMNNPLAHLEQQFIIEHDFKRELYRTRQVIQRIASIYHVEEMRKIAMADERTEEWKISDIVIPNCTIYQSQEDTIELNFEPNDQWIVDRKQQKVEYSKTKQSISFDDALQVDFALPRLCSGYPRFHDPKTFTMTMTCFNDYRQTFGLPSIDFHVDKPMNNQASNITFKKRSIQQKTQEIKKKSGQQQSQEIKEVSKMMDIQIPEKMLHPFENSDSEEVDVNSS